MKKNDSRKSECLKTLVDNSISTETPFKLDMSNDAEDDMYENVPDTDELHLMDDFTQLMEKNRSSNDSEDSNKYNDRESKISRKSGLGLSNLDDSNSDDRTLDDYDVVKPHEDLYENYPLFNNISKGDKTSSFDDFEKEKEVSVDTTVREKYNEMKTLPDSSVLKEVIAEPPVAVTSNDTVTSDDAVISNDTVPSNNAVTPNNVFPVEMDHTIAGGSEFDEVVLEYNERAVDAPEDVGFNRNINSHNIEETVADLNELNDSKRSDSLGTLVEKNDVDQDYCAATRTQTEKHNMALHVGQKTEKNNIALIKAEEKNGDEITDNRKDKTACSKQSKNKKADKPPKSKFFGSPKIGKVPLFKSSLFSKKKMYSVDKQLSNSSCEIPVLDCDPKSDLSSLHTRQDSMSDTGSQQSYDVAKASAMVASSNNDSSSISSDPSANTNGNVQLHPKSSPNDDQPKIAPPRPPRSPSNQNSTGGVVLLSNRSLNEAAKSDTTGVTLLSSTSLNNDSGRPVNRAGARNHTDSPNSLPTEVNDSRTTNMTYTFNPLPTSSDDSSGVNKRANQYQSCPIVDWTIEHVSHWLMALELEQYIPMFRDSNIGGSQLLALDIAKLKSIGITSNADRVLLKRKIKDMKTIIDKERKQVEKDKKTKEKEVKKVIKKK